MNFMTYPHPVKKWGEIKQNYYAECPECHGRECTVESVRRVEPSLTHLGTYRPAAEVDLYFYCCECQLAYNVQFIGGDWNQALSEEYTRQTGREVYQPIILPGQELQGQDNFTFATCPNCKGSIEVCYHVLPAPDHIGSIRKWEAVCRTCGYIHKGSSFQHENLVESIEQSIRSDYVYMIQPIETI